MAHPQKESLRPLTPREYAQLRQVSRAQSESAAQLMAAGAAECAGTRQRSRAQRHALSAPPTL